MQIPQGTRTGPGKQTTHFEGPKTYKREGLGAMVVVGKHFTFLFIVV